MRTKRVIAVISVLGLTVGAILFMTSSSAGSSASFESHRIRVHFTRFASIERNCRAVDGYVRETRGSDVLHDAMLWQLRGPRRSEMNDGVVSLFSRRTAGMLNSVRIDNRTAYIDFDDFRRVLSSATSACGSASLLSELNHTAKQFPTVDRAVYSIEGSVNAFYNWLQRDPPGMR